MNKVEFKRVLSDIYNQKQVKTSDLFELINYTLDIMGKTFDEHKLLALLSNPGCVNVIINTVLNYISINYKKFDIQPVVIIDKNGKHVCSIIYDLDKN